MVGSATPGPRRVSIARRLAWSDVLLHFFVPSRPSRRRAPDAIGDRGLGLERAVPAGPALAEADEPGGPANVWRMATIASSAWTDSGSCVHLIQRQRDVARAAPARLLVHGDSAR